MSTEDEPQPIPRPPEDPEDDDPEPLPPQPPESPHAPGGAPVKLAAPPGPIPAGFMANPNLPGRPQVDKYFGSKLPPVCRQLGCYVTDDGRFFYCINPNCHKDRKRETKYNRRRRGVLYFACPKCKSREIELHLRTNSYECMECVYTWKQ